MFRINKRCTVHFYNTTKCREIQFWVKTFNLLNVLHLVLIYYQLWWVFKCQTINPHCCFSKHQVFRRQCCIFIILSSQTMFARLYLVMQLSASTSIVQILMSIPIINYTNTSKKILTKYSLLQLSKSTSCIILY